MVKQYTEKQLDTINLICELPRVDKSFYYTATEDQQKKLILENIRWLCVGISMTSYFSNSSIKNAIESIKNVINIDSLEITKLDTRRWCYLYTLINVHWDVIEANLEKYPDIINWSQYYSCSYECEFSNFTPNKVFNFIIEQESLYCFKKCFEDYYEFKPRKLYKDYLRLNNIRNNIANVTNAERKYFKALIREHLPYKRESFSKGHILHDQVIELLQKYGDCYTKTDLNHYQAVASDLEKLCLKKCGSGDIKAYAWLKGKCLLSKGNYFS